MPPPRVWLYALPLIILAAAQGVLSGAKRSVRVGATATCLLLAVGYLVARTSMPGFELRFYGQVQRIADEMTPQLAPDDAVIVPTPMSDPLQLRFIENDPRLKVGYDPRDLDAGRRTLEGRRKVWIVRPRPDSYLGWENGRREYDLSQPYLNEFAEPRRVAATDHLEVWVIERR